MQSKKAFTLVELVVVVMILGILAAVAAPKLLGTSKDASENAVRQSLAVVRDAIERYAADNGGQLPGTDEPTFKTALKDYLHGPFPNCQVGKKNSDVWVNAADPIAADIGEDQAWVYSTATGEFIINDTGDSETDPSLTFDKF
jgi:general secretion pathway protein G